MNERRQSIRVECELPSRFRNLDPSYPPKVAEATVKNISRGGVCIRVDEFVPIQCHLHFYLTLPNHKTIEVRLVPTWIIELPHLKKYEAGARFVDMRQEDEEAIQGFQYRALLERMPFRPNIVKDLLKDDPDSGIAA